MVDRLGEDKVLYSKGCNNISTTDEMLEEAIKTAKEAEIVMLVLGDSSPVGGGAAGGMDPLSKSFAT